MHQCNIFSNPFLQKKNNKPSIFTDETFFAGHKRELILCMHFENRKKAQILEIFVSHGISFEIQNLTICSLQIVDQERRRGNSTV